MTIFGIRLTASVARSLRAAACLASLAWLTAKGANTFTIGGKLVDASGKPVAATLVVASVRPATGHPLTFSARSDATGAFSIASSVQGGFRLCVPGSPQYLDPCQWPGSATSGTIGAASANAGTIALEAGAPLQIQINDAAGLLTAAEAKGGAASILVGVWTTKGIFIPIPVVSKSAAARMHQSLVSTKTALHVTINSPAFIVADFNRNALPADGTLANLTVPSSGASLTATIMGPK